jgi:hypothetical protein
MGRGIRALTAAGAVAAMSVVGASAASADSLPHSCSSGHQIGGTAYITFHGEKAASIKQYYGYCGGAPRNWAYVWVWDSFRAHHPNVRALAAIEDDTPPDGGDYSGSTSYLKRQEVISHPTPTTHDCTRAVGFVKVRLPGARDPEYADGYTGQRC